MTEKQQKAIELHGKGYNCFQSVACVFAPELDVDEVTAFRMGEGFGLGMGKSFFAEAPLMLAFSWSILMSLNVLFSNLWGILLHEWRGVDRRTAAVLVTGLLILIFSTVYPQLVK